MNPIRWLSHLLHRRRTYAHITAAIQEHLDEAAAELMDLGLSKDEAMKRARREFGNPSLVEQRSRDVWQVPLLESTAADLRFATRSLAKSPAFTLTAIAIVGLGLAASIAIFAFFNAALLKQLPYQAPSRLVAIAGASPSCTDCGLSYLDYQDLSHSTSSFRSFDVWAADAYLWRSPSGTRALRVARVSGGFFNTLGVTPALGRLFTTSDDGPSAQRTVVLPYNTWLRDFGGQPGVIGQYIILDETTYTIIGVLPRTFEFAPRAAELWVTIHNLGACENDRSCRSYTGVARLRDGLTVKAANTAIHTIATRLQTQYPVTNQDQSASVLAFRQYVTSSIRPVLLTLFSGASILLLIALTNTATLFLVRGESRRHEMAIRNALGASLPHLLRQLGAEAAILVAISIPLGLANAWASVHLLAPLIAERLLRGMPFFATVALDRNVLLFACFMGLIAWFICTIAPATRLPILSQVSGLSSEARASAGTWRGIGSTLVIVEVALAVTLLVSAGLLGKSLYRILHIQLNFNPDHLVTVEIDANTGYGTAARQVALSHNLIAAVSAMPGVQSAAIIHSSLPVSCNCDATTYRVLGQPWNQTNSPVLPRIVSANYLQTLQTQLLSGRYFTSTDDVSHPAAVIINHTMALRYFSGQNPIGRTIGDSQLSPASLHLVVGIIQDIHEGTLSDPPAPAAYFPADQNPGSNFFLVARTTQDAAAALPSMVQSVHNLDPQIGVRNEFTMEQHIHDSPDAYFRSIAAVLLGGFSVGAVLLGATGLYGVIAYSVGRRQREIGIRMALGAQRNQIRQLILGEGMRVVGAGLFCGILATILTGPLLRSLLFAGRSWDPVIVAMVVSTLAAVSFTAAWLPARRAASVDPNETLRGD